MASYFIAHRLITISLLLVCWLCSARAGAADLLLQNAVFGVPGVNASFDYVVVGGGTAGLVVATRLAEGAKSVAVIEAGGFYGADAGNLSTVPAYAVFGAGASPDDVLPGVDWGFVTTPQAGMDGRRLHYARGKTLGGSSARNYFTYHRPTVDALNQWAALVDDESYSFDNFWPYFKKSVNCTAPDNDQRPANASVPSPSGAFLPGAGPLSVSFPTWVNAFSTYADRAWQSLGTPVSTDFVSGNLSGVQYSMNTVSPDGQVRDTSYSSFLQKVTGAIPIQVYNNTLAKRILFDDDGAATGVLVASQGLEYTVSANKEVILSAGAVIPQLLMVSGVGPADTLQRLNIPVISELGGVGQNLQDHLLFGASYQVDMLTHAAVSNPAYLNEARDEYNAESAGILTNPGRLSDATRGVLAAVPADFPTFEYIVLDAYSGDNQDYSQGGPDPSAMYASPAASLMVPQSRGNVTITSSDTAVAPSLNPNWLTHPADQELAVYAFRRVRQMMDAEVMKGAWTKEVLPGREVESDADILAAIKQTGIQMFHASATCKMGNSTDTSAVVDSHGRPFGTKRLRVIDASVLPFLPRATRRL
ncbi:GMC oxidoreductase [Apiospora sp. TS-2023a]